MSESMWWGYRCKDGTIQVKQWKGHSEEYTNACFNDILIVKVVEPFSAFSFENAQTIVKEMLT